MTRHAITQRHSRLVRFYEAGELGLGHDGFIYKRDGVKLSLRRTPIAEKLIDMENNERKTLVFVIADGNHRRDAGESLGIDARALARAVAFRLVAARCRRQMEPQALTQT